VFWKQDIFNNFYLIRIWTYSLSRCLCTWTFS
jgi:hypothetical protein